MSQNNVKTTDQYKKSDPQAKRRSGRGGVASDFKGTVKRILIDLIQNRLVITTILVTAVISTLFNILGPKQLGRATTLLFDGVVARIQGVGDINFKAIGKQLLFVLGLYVISASFSTVQSLVTTDLTQNFIYKLRGRVMDKVNRLPMSYFEQRTHGETLSIVTNDIDALSNGLNQIISAVIDAVVTLIGIAIIMFTINVPMTLIALLIIPISFMVVSFLTSRSQKYFRAQQEILADMNGMVEETYSGQAIVRAYNKEEDTAEVFDKKNKNMYKATWHAQFFSGTLYPSMDFVSQLAYIGVVISGAHFVITGSIDVGDIQAFTQYINRFTQPITQLSQTVTQLQPMVAAAERIYEFLDHEEVPETGTKDLDVKDIKGHVVFDHVAFRYQEDTPVIKDFSAEAKPGQKVALVGPTGAGKSTMVKLLMRFYDVNDGRILLDGTPITEYDRKAYRKGIAMVLQDTWLFHGTIMDNLRYGRLDATDEEIYEAAKSARVHRFIKSLPDGYNFMINEEGTNISQGQKQLLTIARAFIADRPILILDEATSSVDTRTELLIQEAMDELMKGRTSFVIAHRLSTIRDADLILYMEQGDIVEQGNHDELMKLNAKYANLYNSQFSQG